MVRLHSKKHAFAHVQPVKVLMGGLDYFWDYAGMTFSTLTAPITKLLQNEVPFEWSAECDKIFNEIKMLIAESIKLYFLDYEQDVLMHPKLVAGRSCIKLSMGRRLRQRQSQRQSKDGVLSNRNPMQCSGQ